MVIQRTFRSYMRNRDWAWFTIIQKTRPLIGMPNPEEELAILENIAKEKYGAYEEQLETKKKLEAENEVLRNEIGGLKERLQNEQGDLSSYEEKIAKLNTQNADLEAQLAENMEKIKQEECLLKEREIHAKEREIHAENMTKAKEEIQRLTAEAASKTVAMVPSRGCDHFLSGKNFAFTARTSCSVSIFCHNGGCIQGHGL